MGYRGRLIRPMIVKIQQINMLATRSGGGYDDTLDEPKLVAVPDVGGIPPIGSPRGPAATVYNATILLSAQINPISMEQQRQMGTGNDPLRTLELTFHFRDLEALGMIGTDGQATLQINDRLVGIASPDYNTNEDWRIDQYLYAMGDQNDSYGLPGADRNLLILTFQERKRGVPNTS